MGTLKIRGIGPIAIMSRIIYNIRDMKGGGIVDNGYTKRIRERVLSLEDGTVFVMSDFADIADTSTIRQSLSRLVQSGTLRRILKGVYEKPKYSKLLDEYVAADPEAVANALARSYHWTIAPCGNTALNLLGLSTQVTAVWSYISDDIGAAIGAFCVNAVVQSDKPAAQGWEQVVCVLSKFDVVTAKTGQVLDQNHIDPLAR